MPVSVVAFLVVTVIALTTKDSTTKTILNVLMVGFILFFFTESIRSILRQCRGTLRPHGNREDLAELHRICSLTPEQAKQEGFTVVYDAERDGGPIRVDPGETITITREKLT